jgi:hypothetical protein
MEGKGDRISVMIRGYERYGMFFTVFKDMWEERSSHRRSNYCPIISTSLITNIINMLARINLCQVG